MATDVAPKRGTGKKRGRPFFVMLLVGFLLVATGVIARRTFGIGQARDIRARETQRDALEATRVQLEVDIRDASSRARLGPVAERRLNMRVPSDSQVIILKREPKS